MPSLRRRRRQAARAPRKSVCDRSAWRRQWFAALTAILTLIGMALSYSVAESQRGAAHSTSFADQRQARAVSAHAAPATSGASVIDDSGSDFKTVPRRKTPRRSFVPMGKSALTPTLAGRERGSFETASSLKALPEPVALESTHAAALHCASPPEPLPRGIRLCECLTPASPYPIWGVDSATGGGCGEVGWDARGMIPWQEFAQGEYVGHARIPHVPEYRLRESDVLAVYYRRTRDELSRPYELQVGDRIRVESLTAGGGIVAPEVVGAATGDTIARDLIVQPDGTITLPLLGQVRATRRTIPALRDELEERYKEYFRAPTITVTPLAVDTKLEDLLKTVDSRSGIAGGLQIQVTVTPAGDIQLPGINSVFVQGLTMEEAKQEIDARYDATIPGVHVTLVLSKRAPRFVYVLGEVYQPGRFELPGPTSAVQSLALAGSYKPGANLRQVVVFRRGPDWRLMATMLDLRGALYGRRPVPADDIWLNDSDIVLVPKSPIQQADEIIEQYFTRGLYSVVPREVLWNIGFVSESAL